MFQYKCMSCEQATTKPIRKVDDLLLGVFVTIKCPNCYASDTTYVSKKDQEDE